MSSTRRLRKVPWLALAAGGCALLALAFFGAELGGLSLGTTTSSSSLSRQRVLISYSYFEKDDIQASNFAFWLRASGVMGDSPRALDWVIVVSGTNCTPCGVMQGARLPRRPTPSLNVSRAAKLGYATVLFRPNDGMDFAAHNATFEYLKSLRRLWVYRYFILLNSSVKGPFYPSYMPPGFHWTHAYLTRFRSNIHAVGSSLVCLPEKDAGGPGPRLESWAIALDYKALQLAISNQVFKVRDCKLCVTAKEGIVVGGEYGLSISMLDAGWNLATLMSRYAVGVDWRDKKHWSCNDNVHPSRHGTYDGIAFHPFETVYVKSSWHVADPYTKRYTRWASEHLIGEAGTDGRFNETLYKYSVSPEAQLPNLLELGYQITINATNGASPPPLPPSPPSPRPPAPPPPPQKMGAIWSRRRRQR